MDHCGIRQATNAWTENVLSSRTRLTGCSRVRKFAPWLCYLSCARCSRTIYVPCLHQRSWRWCQDQTKTIRRQHPIWCGLFAGRLEQNWKYGKKNVILCQKRSPTDHHQEKGQATDQLLSTKPHSGESRKSQVPGLEVTETLHWSKQIKSATAKANTLSAFAWRNMKACSSSIQYTMQYNTIQYNTIQ